MNVRKPIRTRSQNPGLILSLRPNPSLQFPLPSPNPIQSLLQNKPKIFAFTLSLSPSKPSLRDESSLLQSVDVASASASASLVKGRSTGHLTKEELGRGTWALLHTIAAEYPDQPTRQQKKDAKELMAILSRLYPCKECADHFKDILNLGKLTFPCQRVDARWGKLDWKDRTCDLQGTSDLK